MLVSVNPDQGTVTVYGATNFTVPISDYHKLTAMLSGQVVQYVTEVVLANGEEVLDMLADLSYGGGYKKTPTSIPSDGRLWIRATGSGILFHRLDAQTKFDFRSPIDFVSLDKYGYDIAERFPIVQHLLAKKKLEIVDTPTMNRIKKEHAIKMKKRDDELYGSILLNKPISQIDRRHMTGSIADEQRGEIIDMDAEIGDQNTPQTEAEAIQALPEEMRIAIQEGWGKQEPTEQEGTEVQE